MADDHLLFTNGISAVLNEVPGIVFCRSFLNGKELLDWYTGSNVDVILLDIDMPILNGKEASKQLLTYFPASKIIILSDDDDQTVMRLMQDMGVYAYLTKSASLGDLIRTIIKVHAGEKVFNQDPTTTPGDITVNIVNASVSKLSDREMQVLKLIIKGRTNLQIAAELYLSPLTIKTHRQNLMRKLEANNTAQLIAKAGLKGLL